MKKFQTGLALALSAVLSVTLFSGCMANAKAASQKAPAAAENGSVKVENLASKTPAKAEPAGQEVTSGGCTIQLKSVQTDGYVARILLGITTPEGTDIPNEEMTQVDFFNNGGTFTSGKAEPMVGTQSIALLDDGDGKDNTVDMQMDFWAEAKGGKPVYTNKSEWELKLVDLRATRWNEKENSTEEKILADGAWELTVRFDETNMDEEELELISSPVEAKASVGFGEDGKDVMETFSITSVKLRKFSSQITAKALPSASVPEGAEPDFYIWPGHQTCAVMKDGTQVKLYRDGNQQPLDLSQVDHVILADGTKLPAVQK